MGHQGSVWLDGRAYPRNFQIWKYAVSCSGSRLSDGLEAALRRSRLQTSRIREVSRLARNLLFGAPRVAFDHPQCEPARRAGALRGVTQAIDCDDSRDESDRLGRV